MDSGVLIGIVTTGVASLVIITLGIILLAARGSGSWLIAGYNTLPKEYKEKYDKAALCKFVGKIVLTIGIIMLALIVGFLKPEWFTIIVIGFIVAAVGLSVFAVIYANTGNRFKK